MSGSHLRFIREERGLKDKRKKISHRNNPGNLCMVLSFVRGGLCLILALKFQELLLTSSPMVDWRRVLCFCLSLSPGFVGMVTTGQRCNRWLWQARLLEETPINFRARQRQGLPGTNHCGPACCGFQHKRGPLWSQWQQASFSPEARVWQEYVFPVASGCGRGVRMLATAHS